MKRLLPTLLTLGFTAAAAAQSGPEMLLVPWEPYTDLDPERPTLPLSETDVDAWATLGGDVDGGNEEDINLYRGEVTGRFRLDRTGPSATPYPGDGLAFGYDAHHLGIDTLDPAIPERLSDLSAGLGGLYTVNDNLRLGGTLGAGYASNRPFAEAEGLYGLASIVAEFPIDDSSSITAILSYDGNRTLFPDLPLPAVMYNHRVSDKLFYVVGIPYSTIRYRPAPQWDLSLGYSLPLTLDATARYHFSRAFSLYASYDQLYDAYWIEEEENRRLFFVQRRVELGGTYRANGRAAVDVTVAVGYAFDMSFERGWDVRDLDTVRDLEAQPYVRAGVGFRF